MDRKSTEIKDRGGQLICIGDFIAILFFLKAYNTVTEKNEIESSYNYGTVIYDKECKRYLVDLVERFKMIYLDGKEKTFKIQIELDNDSVCWIVDEDKFKEKMRGGENGKR